MKRTLLTFLLFFSFLSAQDITGYWKTVDEETGKARCVVAIYEHDGLRYGRIIGTYDDKGVMTENIYKAVTRAPGVVGNPFYCGLDIIWNLENRRISYRGKILDPQHGKVYNAELWVQDGNLIVRGKLLMFGRNQTWYPALKSDFPADFKVPELSSLVPKIPDVD